MTHVRSPERPRNTGRKRARGVLVTIAGGAPGTTSATLATDIAAALVQRRIRAVVEPASVADLRTVGDGSPHDVAIATCDAGTHETDLRRVLASDLLVLVIAPGDAGLLEGYALLKWFCRKGYHGRIAVLICGIPEANRAERRAARFRRVAREFLGREVAYVGSSPRRPRTSAPVADKGGDHSPGSVSPASLCVGAICDQIAPLVLGTARGRTWWGQLASLFL